MTPPAPETLKRGNRGRAPVTSYYKEVLGLSYFFAAPRPPRRQELQIPKPLPTLATTPQPYARRANSPALRVEGVKAVSVTRIRAGGRGSIGMKRRTPCGHPRNESRSSRQKSGVVAASHHRHRCKQLDHDGRWVAPGKRVDDKVVLRGQGNQPVRCYRAGTAGHDFFTRIVDINVDADRAGNGSAVPNPSPAPRAPVFVILITESPIVRFDAYFT